EKCQRLLALEQRLPKALKGDQLPPAEYLALAHMCLVYKKRYVAAAEFYAKAFAAKPELARAKGKLDGYNAACAAVLAAEGKGVGAASLPDKEKSRLRQQALVWLQGNLGVLRDLLWRNPAAADIVQKIMQDWQKSPGLVAVRDEQELPRLPELE